MTGYSPQNPKSKHIRILFSRHQQPHTDTGTNIRETRKGPLSPSKKSHLHNLQGRCAFSENRTAAFCAPYISKEPRRRVRAEPGKNERAHTPPNKQAMLAFLHRRLIPLPCPHGRQRPKSMARPDFAYLPKPAFPARSPTRQSIHSALCGNVLPKKPDASVWDEIRSGEDMEPLPTWHTTPKITSQPITPLCGLARDPGYIPPGRRRRVWPLVRGLFLPACRRVSLDRSKIRTHAINSVSR